MSPTSSGCSAFWARGARTRMTPTLRHFQRFQATRLCIQCDIKGSHTKACNYLAHPRVVHRRQSVWMLISKSAAPYAQCLQKPERDLESKPCLGGGPRGGCARLPRKLLSSLFWQHLVCASRRSCAASALPHSGLMVLWLPRRRQQHLTHVRMCL